MTAEDHHQDALIETARLELDRAHRAALGMQAGEVRRGLELALAALQAAEAVEGSRTTGLASRIGTRSQTLTVDPWWKWRRSSKPCARRSRLEALCWPGLVQAFRQSSRICGK